MRKNTFYAPPAHRVDGRTITQALKKNEKELLERANVVGCGIGEKIKGGLATGRLCLKVYVEKKLPEKELKKDDLVPKMLSPIETDVEHLLDFPSKKMYNIIKNIVSANVSLNLKDLPDAKRASKYSFYLRRKGTNLSCWYTNNLSVCKITSVKEIPSEVSSPFTSQHVLPLGRPDFISFLFYCYWDRTFYSSIYTQGQRTTSTIDWVKSFSWNSSNERFLIRINSTRFSSNRKSTRLLRFKMFQYPAPLTTFIVDFDSVVLTVYGHQEGSAKNRNAFNSN